MIRGWIVDRIISGGQTGVDRGALTAAVELGIPHGGWCPRGRRAEDGIIPIQFQLSETESPEYHVRTRLNVEEADGTLILHRGLLAGGTELTRIFALRRGKPLLIVNLDQPHSFPAIRQWLIERQIRVLNVAGPRESSHPGIEQAARVFLDTLFREWPAPITFADSIAASLQQP